MNDDAEFLQLGKRIRKIRELTGLKQAEFARQSGIAERSLRYYENDEQEPTASALRNILLLAESKGIQKSRWLLIGSDPEAVSNLRKGEKDMTGSIKHTLILIEALQKSLAQLSETLSTLDQLRGHLDPQNLGEEDST